MISAMNDGHLYQEVIKLLRTLSEYKKYKPLYILNSKKARDDPIAYLACSNQIICMTTSESKSIKYKEIINIDDSYSIDKDLFKHLENDYEIHYMPIEQHHVIWNSLTDDLKDVSYREGLNRYILYCKENGITAKSIYSLTGYPVSDIYPLFKEMNAGFTVIEQMSFGGTAIVLGEKNGPYGKEYVTWRTTPSRKGGYDIGHYFTGKKEAYNDYKIRCMNMVEKYFDMKELKLKNRKQER